MGPRWWGSFLYMNKVKTCEQYRRHIIFMKFGHSLEEFKNGSGLLKKHGGQGGHLLFIMLPQSFWGEHIFAASSVCASAVHNFCPGYFSAINDRNSIKLYGKLHYQEEMCTLSAGSRSMIFHRVMAL